MPRFPKTPFPFTPPGDISEDMLELLAENLAIMLLNDDMEVAQAMESNTPQERKKKSARSPRMRRAAE
jgi:hypothetical protein